MWIGCGNVDNRIELAGLDPVISVLREAERVVVTSGAGMSRECGIPTFREAQTGLWARYDPTQLASPEGFRSDPARVFGWYMWRRALVEAAVPHAGYEAVVRLGEIRPELTVVTQNVDGLHRRAGSPSVLELHGSLCRYRCADCAAPHPARGLPTVPESGRVAPPACRRCGGLVRPDVVWFGEPLPADALDAAWRAAERCDVMLVVGTSGLVQPAASLPVVARRSGAYIVEVNPEETELTAVAATALRGTAGRALPALVEALESP